MGAVLDNAPARPPYWSHGFSDPNRKPKLWPRVSEFIGPGPSLISGFYPSLGRATARVTQDPLGRSRCVAPTNVTGLQS